MATVYHPEVEPETRTEFISDEHRLSEIMEMIRSGRLIEDGWFLEGYKIERRGGYRFLGQAYFVKLIPVPPSANDL